MRTKVLLNVLCILAFAGMVGYAYYGIGEITKTMADERVAQGKFVERLVNENWQGITSFSNSDKKALLNLFRPPLVVQDIWLLCFIIKLLLAGYLVGVTLDRSVALFKLWRTRRRSAVAP